MTTLRICGSFNYPPFGPWVCGLDLSPNGVVVHTAPLLKWMRGWEKAQVIRYVQFKHWSVEEV